MSPVPRTNVVLTPRLQRILDDLLPIKDKSQTEEWLPYIFWAFAVRRMDGDTVTVQSGPGYQLGAIRARDVDGSMTLAVSEGRPFAVRLNGTYDPRALYTADRRDGGIIIDVS